MLFQKVLLGLDLELLHRQLERHPRERLDLGGHILPHLGHLCEEIFKLEDTGPLVVYGLEAYAWKVSCDCNVMIYSSVHGGKLPESRSHKLPVLGLQHGPGVPK